MTTTVPVSLKAATPTLINRSFSSALSPPKYRVLTFSRRRSNVRISAATQAQAQTQVQVQAQAQAQAQAVIEHIVLLKVPSSAPDPPPSPSPTSSTAATGPRTTSPAIDRHPTHVSVAEQFVYPNCDDIMAVDWVQEELTGPVGLSPGSAIRVSFLKLKENVGEAAKGEILEVLKGRRFGEVGQISVGENFSPERAKGYSIASLAVFKGVSEMEAVEEQVGLDKVRDYVEGVIDLDYVVSRVSEH
ncbi:hypothetical protein M0R45_003646 [Rubus argutus]|uniref:Stress-response A/B barrel domain-containing protein n=1 Tax=Rubus argutus TaxID=59490 RepID=A0AAW1YGU3_RUBAR